MKALHRGIVYVATGEKYLSEAFANISITRSFNPSIPITIVSDIDISFTSDPHTSTLVLDNPSFSYIDKIKALSASLPFAHNLFLDSDAFAVDNLDDLFDMLLPFDLSACFAPVSIPPGWVDPTIPISFPEYNTGVLYLKNSPIIQNFLDDWFNLYNLLLTEFQQTWDQASFRSVLWKYMESSRLGFYCLSSSFNVRTSKPWTVGRGQKASIIHGRFNHAELPVFIDYLNHDVDKFRTWIHWIKRFPETSIFPKFDRTDYNI